METYKQDLQNLVESASQCFVKDLQELINDIDNENYTIINYVPMCAKHPLPTIREIFIM